MVTLWDSDKAAGARGRARAYHRAVTTRRRSGKDAASTLITSAPESLADDLARRQRRYLAQMSFRVVCFVLGGALWGRVPTIVPVLLLVAATVLPYIAVVLANAGRERPTGEPSTVDPRRLDAGRPTHGHLGGRE